MFLLSIQRVRSVLASGRRARGRIYSRRQLTGPPMAHLETEYETWLGIKGFNHQLCGYSREWKKCVDIAVAFWPFQAKKGAKGAKKYWFLRHERAERKEMGTPVPIGPCTYIILQGSPPTCTDPLAQRQWWTGQVALENRKYANTTTHAALLCKYCSVPLMNKYWQNFFQSHYMMWYCTRRFLLLWRKQTFVFFILNPTSAMLVETQHNHKRARRDMQVKTHSSVPSVGPCLPNELMTLATVSTEDTHFSAIPSWLRSPVENIKTEDITFFFSVHF